MEPENNVVTSQTSASQAGYDQKPAPIIPETWPGALGAYAFSRDSVKYNLWVYLLLLLAPYAITAIAAIMGAEETARDIISTIAHTIFGATTIIVILAAFRGVKISATDAFKQTNLMLFIKYFILGILIGIIYVVSLLLLIVPFFFVAPRLVLAPYFLVDKNLGILESLQTSWDATKGNVSKVYGIVGIFIVMTLLMITIIGIPFSIYFLIMYSAVFPLLYLYLQKQQALQPSPSITTNPSPDPLASVK